MIFHKRSCSSCSFSSTWFRSSNFQAQHDYPLSTLFAQAILPLSKPTTLAAIRALAPEEVSLVEKTEKISEKQRWFFNDQITSHWKMKNESWRVGKSNKVHRISLWKTILHSFYQRPLLFKTLNSPTISQGRQAGFDKSISFWKQWLLRSSKVVDSWNCRSSVAQLSTSLAGQNARPICDRLNGLSPGQSKICNVFEDHMPAVGVGAKNAIQVGFWPVSHDSHFTCLANNLRDNVFESCSR